MRKYIEILRKIVPQDENISEQNLSAILYNINNGTSINEIFHSNMMFITIAAFVKLLYDDDKVYFNGDNIVGKNLSDVHNPFNANILRTDVYLSNGDITQEIFSNRKTHPNLSFFQSYNTYNSLKRRLLVMQQFGDLDDKRVVFLGDDELFSVFFALNAKSYKHILVLDIDEFVLKEIDYYSNKYSLNIETRMLDVFCENNITPDFDLFFASGLKNLAGLLLFVYTGACLLNKNGKEGGYFTYYPYANSLANLKKEQDKYNYFLQKNLIEHGLFMEHLSVCDEIKIDNTICKDLVKWVQNGSDYLIINDMNFMESVQRNGELTADPLFPYFSLRPINLARIKRHLNCDQKISKYIKLARRLNDGKMELK